MTDDTSRSQFPVQTSRPRDWLEGDARIIVARDSVDAVRKVNGAIADADDLARRSNLSATLAPKATDMIAVYDIDSRAYHSIFLYRLDLRPRRAAAVGKVVVFSDPRYAPGRTEKLQLATPGYYRDHKDLQPGIGDPHDGKLAKDGSRWASSVMGGTVSARLTFVSSGEPWVYCASHYGSDSELRRLWREFETKYGYSAATRILDPDAFAAWLGVDFALGLDKTTHVSLGSLDDFCYARSRYTTSLWERSSPIDTFVRVYYGPVTYENVSGRVDKQEQWFDPNAGPRAWFTKKTTLANQNEYRFAVSTLGDPVAETHYIAVSPEMRALTRLV
ncbi:MAG: hypothetical protein OXG44_16860 [Gammaproteobacteria bacterium]|nr:hypothetical protein [Gammaproteobacteria bacterium]